MLLAIPRRYSKDLSLPAARCWLVGFCDASKSAHAAVMYLFIGSDLGCSTQFVACKTCVSLIKEQTIPHLELLSALLLSKLVYCICPKLSLGEPSYYTDSNVSLYWIKGQEREWKPFVQNRVNQIRSITLPYKWAHCAVKENPADIPSIGIDLVGSCTTRSGSTVPVGFTVESLTWKTQCRCHKRVRLNSRKSR